MTLYLLLFAAGLLTILLPCILPLLPIAVGAGAADRHPLRPLILALGMVVGFVGITFLLYVVLSSFVTAANAIQYGTQEVLYLFGIGFLFERKWLLLGLSALGGLFFLPLGWIAVIIAAVVSVLLMLVAGGVGGRLQQAGSTLQNDARGVFGERSLMTAFILGLTMGLVWVPCAGPALGFALTLVRTQPGLQAFFALTCYAIGAAVPVLLLGYGGQFVGERMKGLRKFTGTAKHVAGVIFILTAVALRSGYLMDLQTWLVNNTAYGTFGTTLEEQFFPTDMPGASTGVTITTASGSSMTLPTLPKLSRAPEFVGLGPWHNSQPFTLASLKGKVVLVDFWTYSCINCIRTLPYVEGYAKKFKDEPFVIVGVHTPEFTFEKDENNVSMAITKYGLTYPVAQDNDYKTWDAFSNHYWPAKYLIDKDGYIRYEHFGEGGYDETDLAIQSLLVEDGQKPIDSVTQNPASGPNVEISPETYLDSRSWPAFGNGPILPSSDPKTYTVPTQTELNKYYLGGTWQLTDNERDVLQSETGEIVMPWQGGEINLVMGLEPGAAPATGDVYIDGKKVKTITVKDHDLYNLFTGAPGNHTLELKLSGKGVSAYAFTFGTGS